MNFSGKTRRIAPRPGSRLIPAKIATGDRVPVRTLASLLLVLAGLAVGFGPVWNDGTAQRLAQATGRPVGPLVGLASVPETGVEPLAVTCEEAVDELALRTQLVGAWEDDHMGRRVMTLRPDGSGTMLVELRGPAKLLVAPKLLFNLNWSVKSRTLSLTMTGGEPAKKVEMITRRYGDRATQHIEEIDGQWLLVHDLDDGDEFEFRRLEPTITQLQ